LEDHIIGPVNKQRDIFQADLGRLLGGTDDRSVISDLEHDLFSLHSRSSLERSRLGLEKSKLLFISGVAGSGELSD
jgi:hypothetical protein